MPVDVAKDTEQTHESTGGVGDSAHEGERRTRFGGCCSRAQLVGLVVLVVLLVVLALVLGLQ